MILLVATSGMSVFRSYCTCENHAVISFLTEPENCHHEEHETCCSDAVCCNNEVKHQGDTCSNCGHQEVFFVKLDSNVVLANSLSVPPLFEKYISVSITDQIEKISLSGYNDTLIEYNDPPPVKSSGKKIITYIHQFKFDQPDSFLFA